MKQNIRRSALCLIALMTLIVAILLAGCGGSGSGSGSSDGDGMFADYPKADMTGYSGLRGVKSDTVYADLTVKDLKILMENGESFALYVGYADCPWCNTLIPYISEVAQDYGGEVGYLDTRKDPSWQSNMDITNYDVFVKLFDEFIRKDEEGKKHLYVPVIFFVKDGKPISVHEGVVDGLEGPDDILSDSQEKALKKILSDGFKSIK